MKIVFLGTADFSAEILKAIMSTNHNVVGVVCQPDKVNCRNNKINFCKVKNLAVINNKKLFQFKNINEHLDQLKNLNCDLMITAGYGQILCDELLNVAKYGIFNVHASLLPKYRGASPIQSALINAEKVTGITIMKTAKKVDSGQIYLQKTLEINAEDNAITLFEKLSKLGAMAIVEFLNNFKHFYSNGQNQDENQATFCKLLKKSDAKIDFNLPAQQVVGKIKGYALLPAYFMYSGKRYNVYNAKICNEKSDNIKPGTIIQSDCKSGLKIACVAGAVEITQIQPENKKIMCVKDCLNGTKFDVGDVI